MKKQIVKFTGDVLTVEYPTINKTLTVDCAKLPASIYIACDASRHGMKQKLGDTKSGELPSEKYSQNLRVIDGLKEGRWNLEADRDDTPFVVEAVARVKGVSVAKLDKILDGLEEEKAAELVKEWRGNLKVKKAMADLRAERAAKAAEESTEELVIPGLK